LAEISDAAHQEWLNRTVSVTVATTRPPISCELAANEKAGLLKIQAKINASAAIRAKAAVAAAKGKRVRYVSVPSDYEVHRCLGLGCHEAAISGKRFCSRCNQIRITQSARDSRLVKSNHSVGGKVGKI